MTWSSSSSGLCVYGIKGQYNYKMNHNFKQTYLKICICILLYSNSKKACHQRAARRNVRCHRYSHFFPTKEFEFVVYMCANRAIFNKHGHCSGSKCLFTVNKEEKGYSQIIGNRSNVEICGSVLIRGFFEKQGQVWVRNMCVGIEYYY